MGGKVQIRRSHLLLLILTATLGCGRQQPPLIDMVVWNKTTAELENVSVSIGNQEYFGVGLVPDGKVIRGAVRSPTPGPAVVSWLRMGEDVPTAVEVVVAYDQDHFDGEVDFVIWPDGAFECFVVSGLDGYRFLVYMREREAPGMGERQGCRVFSGEPQI